MHDAHHTLLRNLASYWSAKDVDKVVSCFTPSATYSASVHTQSLGEARGHNDIKTLVSKMLAFDGEVLTTISNVFAGEQFGSWCWIYQKSDDSHEIGCDLFEFDRGLIARKDAYRKILT